MNMNDKKTYLDLEEHLNSIASSIDDLDLLYQVTDNEDIDQIQNMLLGISELFHIKIANAFETLENILASERQAMLDKVDPSVNTSLNEYYRESLFDPRN